MVAPIIIGAGLLASGLAGGLVLGSGGKKEQKVVNVTESTQNITNVQDFEFQRGSNFSGNIITDLTAQTKQSPVQEVEANDEGLINNKVLLIAGLGVGGFFVLKGAGVIK